MLKAWYNNAPRYMVLFSFALALIPGSLSTDTLFTCSVNSVCLFIATSMCLLGAILCCRGDNSSVNAITVPDVAYSIFIAMMLILTLIRPNQYIGYHNLALFITYFSWYLCGRFIFEILTGQDHAHVILMVCLAGFAEVAMCILRRFWDTFAVWNPNGSAIFLALVVMMALVYFPVKPHIRLMICIVCVVALCWIASTKCRTAWVGCIVGGIVILCWWTRNLRSWRKSSLIMSALSLLVVTLVAAIALIAYHMKSISVHGRLFLWKMSWQAFSHNLCFGVGPDAAMKCWYQAQATYFAQGCNNTVHKIVAGGSACVLNDYLQMLIETGVMGTIPYLILSMSLIYYACSLWLGAHSSSACNMREYQQTSSCKKEDARTRYVCVHTIRRSSLLPGAALVCISFMAMRLSYTTTLMTCPSLLWNFCSGLVVSGSLLVKCKSHMADSDKAHKRLFGMKRATCLLVALFTVAMMYSVSYSIRLYHTRGYRAVLLNAQKRQPTIDPSTFRRLSNTLLKNDPRFLRFKSLYLMRSGRYVDAAANYARLAALTGNPSVLHEYALCRLVLSQTNMAIGILLRGFAIMPSTLPIIHRLACVYRDVGDVSNAVKYAQLVVNTPMKKDTPQGREFKRNAQKILNELGVQCHDPGMVVFDIHDRKTWNEGKW